MNTSSKKSTVTGLVILVALAGVVLLAGCGSDSNSETASAETSGQDARGGGPAGGMFASLTDEQQQCLEEQGVTIPEIPEGGSGEMPQGEPPEGTTPPDGAPPQGGAEGMPGFEEMQTAMEECGIDMPEPPGDMPENPDGQSSTGGTEASEGTA